jgi:hypothetical protein
VGTVGIVRARAKIGVGQSRPQLYPAGLAQWLAVPASCETDARKPQNPQVITLVPSRAGSFRSSEPLNPVQTPVFRGLQLLKG